MPRKRRDGKGQAGGAASQPRKVQQKQQQQQQCGATVAEQQQQQQPLQSKTPVEKEEDTGIPAEHREDGHPKGDQEQVCGEEDCSPCCRLEWLAAGWRCHSCQRGESQQEQPTMPPAHPEQFDISDGEAPGVAEVFDDLGHCPKSEGSRRQRSMAGSKLARIRRRCRIGRPKCRGLSQGIGWV